VPARFALYKTIIGESDCFSLMDVIHASWLLSQDISHREHYHTRVLSDSKSINNWLWHINKSWPSCTITMAHSTVSNKSIILKHSRAIAHHSHSIPCLSSLLPQREGQATHISGVEIPSEYTNLAPTLVHHCRESAKRNIMPHIHHLYVLREREVYTSDINILAIMSPSQ